jgi:hypothetical protein
VANDPTTKPRGLLLERIAAACIERLPVDEVTVALAAGATDWAPAHATSATVAHLEEFAFTSGQGPCLDALREHAPAVQPDLRTAWAGIRWPLWTPTARQADVGAVFAFPIQAGAITAGALTMYAHQPVVFGRPQFTLALRFADQAFAGLIDVMSGVLTDGSPIDDDELAGQHFELLRGDVHLASGMVMGQTGLRIDQALARLRAFAFATDRSIVDVAHDVVAGRLRFEPDGTSAQ